MPASVVTANSLADGLVVFQTADGWSHDIDRAEVLEDKDAVTAALERAGRDAGANVVVDPAAIEVRREGVHLVPVKLRERIRAAGPTTGHSRTGAAAPQAATA
jgi:hypothetical protein